MKAKKKNKVRQRYRNRKELNKGERVLVIINRKNTMN